MNARLRLVRGAFVSIQDGGRDGHGRHGVGSAGPMDPLGRLLAMRLASVPDEAAPSEPTVEVGPDGAVLGIEGRDVVLAVAGSGAVVRLGHDEVPAPVVLRVPAGRRLVVGGGARWTSVAVVGRLDVQRVLGSVSRHGRTDLGPRWSQGRSLAVRPAPGRAPVRLGRRTPPARGDGPLLLLPAPQTHLFTAEQRARLTRSSLVVAPRGDRMAQRLDGLRLDLDGRHHVVSDGVVAGAVQVQGDGAPWVLLAEHQPTGGYPKIGVLAAVDRCRLVQLPPGAPVRFVWADAAAARARWVAAVDAVEACVASRPRPTPDRLRAAELTGAVDASDRVAAATDPGPSVT